MKHVPSYGNKDREHKSFEFVTMNGNNEEGKVHREKGETMIKVLFYLGSFYLQFNVNRGRAGLMRLNLACVPLQHMEKNIKDTVFSISMRSHIDN